MPRSAKSAGSSRRSKPRVSVLGRRLVAGLNDALAHARGELVLPSYSVTVPEHVDVAGLRHRPRLTAPWDQLDFAHIWLLARSLVSTVNKAWLTDCGGATQTP